MKFLLQQAAAESGKIFWMFLLLFIVDCVKCCMLNLVYGDVYKNFFKWTIKFFFLHSFLEIRFENYQQYLKYTYNEAHDSGRIVEIIETVKNQPRNIPFDFEFNTVDGKEEKSIFHCPFSMKFIMVCNGQWNVLFSCRSNSIWYP